MSLQEVTTGSTTKILPVLTTGCIPQNLAPVYRELLPVVLLEFYREFIGSHYR